MSIASPANSYTLSTLPQTETCVETRALPREPLVERDTIGPFEILETLGSGGMGTVFRVRDDDGRQLAVKVMHETPRPAAIYRFKREFRAIASLRHRHIVELYELFNYYGELFFSMELVEGLPFHSWLLGPDVRPRQPCRDYLRLRDAFAQLARGVRSIHRAGLLHRDLKPANVMVDHSGRVVILDFGLARGRCATADFAFTRRGTLVGTPLYMSPEQSKGDPIDVATDWYSLGCMLYTALTGSPPWAGLRFVQLLHAKQSARPPRPSSIVPGIPADLDDLCMSLIELDTRARPQEREILDCLSSSEASWVPCRSVRRNHDIELSDMHQRFTQGVRQRRAQVFVLEGGTGVGKSDLAHRFLDEISGDAVTLRGRCSTVETIPFNAIDSLVDRFTAWLRSLPNAMVAELAPTNTEHLTSTFPVLSSVETIAARTTDPDLLLGTPIATASSKKSCIAACIDLLRRFSAVYTVVLFLDDFEACDPDSMELLVSLFNHPIPPPITLLTCVRDDEQRGPHPLDLVNASRVARWQLGRGVV